MKKQKKSLPCGYSLFEQKSFKNPSLKLKYIDNWLKSIEKVLSLLVSRSPANFVKIATLIAQILPVVAQGSSSDFYFSTLSGGKNVLITAKSAGFAKQTLDFCNTKNLNSTAITPVIQTILTLCDGSLIKALNGSLPLTVMTDPALACIDSQFDIECASNDSQSVDYVGAGIGILILILMLCCCYSCIKKCFCDSNRDGADSKHVSLDTHPTEFQENLLDEQRETNRLLRKQMEPEFGPAGKVVAVGACIQAVSSCNIL